METRKLIKFGKNSFVVTLPLSWVNKNKLSKGNTIFLKESPEGIVLSSSVATYKEDKKAVIDTQNKNFFNIQKDILMAYFNNNKLIELNGNNLINYTEEINSFVSNLMSLEILEQTTDKIIIKDFLNFEDISLNNIAKRVDNIVRVMLEDCYRAFDEDLQENLKQRDAIINKFYFLSYRMVRSGISDVTVGNTVRMNNIELLQHWQLIEKLETMGDHCKEIVKRIYELQIRKKEKKEEIIIFLDKVNTMYRDSLKAYYTNNKDLSHKITDQSKAFIGELDDYIEVNSGPTIAALISTFKYFVFNIKDICRIAFVRS